MLQPILLLGKGLFPAKVSRRTVYPSSMAPQRQGTYGRHLASECIWVRGTDPGVPGERQSRHIATSRHFLTGAVSPCTKAAFLVCGCPAGSFAQKGCIN